MPAAERHLKLQCSPELQVPAKILIRHLEAETIHHLEAEMIHLPERRLHGCCLRGLFLLFHFLSALLF